MKTIILTVLLISILLSSPAVKSAQALSYDQYNNIVTDVGIDTLTLTVTDNDGTTDSNSMKVTVTDMILAGFPVGKTGQTIVYREGDDGYYTNGQDRYYIDNVNGTATDTMLHMIWQNDYSDNKGYASNGTIPDLNQTRAAAYCNSIDLAGFTDWRLPTRLELMSLVDYSKSPPKLMIDNVFITSWNNYGIYWAGTDYASDTTQAWFVNFGWGDSNRMSKSNTYNVRCVRGDI